jgi:hypothetical protein
LKTTGVENKLEHFSARVDQGGHEGTPVRSLTAVRCDQGLISLGKRWSNTASERGLRFQLLLTLLHTVPLSTFAFSAFVCLLVPSAYISIDMSRCLLVHS